MSMWVADKSTLDVLMGRNSCLRELRRIEGHRTKTPDSESIDPTVPLIQHRCDMGITLQKHLEPESAHKHHILARTGGGSWFGYVTIEGIF